MYAWMYYSGQELMNCIFNISLHLVTLCRLRAWKKSDPEDSAVSCSDNSLPSGYMYTVEDSKVFKLSKSFFFGLSLRNCKGCLYNSVR